MRRFYIQPVLSPILAHSGQAEGNVTKQSMTILMESHRSRKAADGGTRKPRSLFVAVV